MTTAPLLLTLALSAIPGPTPAPAPGAAAEAARGPAILDFHADWCGPCKQMRPRVDLLRENRYPVRSINVDEHPGLAERFRIEGVPTFVIVGADGRELARREGLVEARELADLFREVATPRQAAPQPDASAGATPTPVTEAQRPQIRAASAEAGGRSNPDPWATVVRITVKDRGTLGFGSGTVIDSNPEESIILTCAHIFGVKGPVPRPEQFHKRYPVLVELFDGRLGGPGGQTVRPLGKPIPGEVIDYDFDRDVALVRIRPGRTVPAARVVPPHWKPKANMAMYTVGCSHGEDATAWNTVIQSPVSRYQVPGKRNYEAIECLHSPKQGRSGGGLFTDDGHVAGVCNFAFDPSVGRGLYASPRSIYAILDKNDLSHLYEYQPRGPQLFVAGNDAPPTGRAGSGDVVLRGQSPDGERDSDRGGRVLDVEPIIVPPPEFLSIRLPDDATPSLPPPSNAPAAVPAAGRGDRPGRSGWIPLSPGGPSADRDERSSDRPSPSRPTSGPSRRDW